MIVTELQYVKRDLISIAEAQEYLQQSLNVIDKMVDVSENSKTIMTLANENQLSFYELNIGSLALLLMRNVPLRSVYPPKNMI